LNFSKVLSQLPTCRIANASKRHWYGSDCPMVIEMV